MPNYQAASFAHDEEFAFGSEFTFLNSLSKSERGSAAWGGWAESYSKAPGQTLHDLCTQLNYPASDCP